MSGTTEYVLTDDPDGTRYTLCSYQEVTSTFPVDMVKRRLRPVGGGLVIYRTESEFQPA